MNNHRIRHFTKSKTSVNNSIMQITLGAELPNNKIRLNYVQSPHKPSNTPVYSINRDKADEFIQKYNNQSSNLNKFGIFMTTFGALGGYRYVGKNTFSRLLKGVPLGGLAGFFTGAAIARFQKDKLMEKYGVEQLD